MGKNTIQRIIDIDFIEIFSNHYSDICPPVSITDIKNLIPQQVTFYLCSISQKQNWFSPDKITFKITSNVYHQIVM